MGHAVFVRLCPMALGWLAMAGLCSAQDNYFCRTTGGIVISQPDPPVIMGNLEQFVYEQDGVVSFNFLLMQFNWTPQAQGPASVAGTFIFLGPDQTDTFAGTYEGIGIINDNGIWTGAGTWTADHATGLFTGLTGTGTYTTAFLLDDQSADTTFDGIIVPGPASGALVGLGLLAAGRRRRSAGV